MDYVIELRKRQRSIKVNADEHSIVSRDDAFGMTEEFFVLKRNGDVVAEYPNEDIAGWRKEEPTLPAMPVVV